MIGRDRRLLVVEDEPLTAGLLVEVLRAQGFEAAAAADVLEARQRIETFDPDAVLLDISLGEGPSGLDFAHALYESRPDIAIVFLTRFPDLRTAGLRSEDLPPGSGFLRKDLVRDADYLVGAIDSVLTDRPDSVRHDRNPDKPLEKLSAKQLDVLRLMALGYTNEYIAQVRGVAVSTVERWCVEIFRALEIDGSGSVNRRVEAVRQYIAVVGIPGHSR